MKHIVFIFGNYYPEAGSTSLCTINVINVMKNIPGVKITCICRNDDETVVEHRDGLEIHRVKATSWGKKYNDTGKIKKMILLLYKKFNGIAKYYNFPDRNKMLSNRIYKELELINEGTPIDGIIATYMPYQSVASALIYKKKHQKTPIIGYFLDTMRREKYSHISDSLFVRLCDKAMHKVFTKLDKVILMKYTEDMFQSNYFNDVKGKMVYLNFPSLRIMPIDESHINNFRCNFIGSTYKEIRNPIYAIDVFEYVHKKKNDISFHIYGKTDMVDDLRRISKIHSDFFSYHGFVASNEVERIYEETDYIVSIGNKSKGIVPGKSFELFGKLKPIIHFTDIDNDTSLIFFKQYPNVCVIDMRERVDYSGDKLLSFIKQDYYYCNPKQIRSTYSSAMPDAAVKEIRKILNC